MLPQLNQLGILIDFKLHQEFIAAELCEEKDVEGSTCDGKCHLRKKIKEADENERSQTPYSIETKVEITYFLEELEELLPFPFSANNHSRLYANWQFPHTSAYLGEVFHPPKTLF